MHTSSHTEQTAVTVMTQALSLKTAKNASSTLKHAVTQTTNVKTVVTGAKNDK